MLIRWDSGKDIFGDVGRDTLKPGRISKGIRGYSNVGYPKENLYWVHVFDLFSTHRILCSHCVDIFNNTLRAYRGTEYRTGG